MPQMNKGGKFIFGKSLVREDGSIRLPTQAVEEYGICQEGRVYLFTGAKATGGFCITRKGLLLPSSLGHILEENPELCVYSLPEGKMIRYKGREYGWTAISPEGTLMLSEEMRGTLGLAAGMELLSIRSSNIAFTMGAKGPLMERAEHFSGTIAVY